MAVSVKFRLGPGTVMGFICEDALGIGLLVPKKNPGKMVGTLQC